MIPAIQENDSLLIILNEDDQASICSQQLYPIPDSIISIEYGPELIFERNNNFYRMWNSLWASAANGELSGNNMSEFVIHNPDNSTTRVNIVQTTSGENAEEWSIIESVNELTPGENRFSFSPPETCYLQCILIMKTEKVYIYLGSYS